MIADIAAAPLLGCTEFASREEAMEEAVRIWELMGRIGKPAVNHYIVNGEWRCMPFVIETLEK